MKRDLAERAAKTKAALDALDPATRLAMEVIAARLPLPPPPLPRGIVAGVAQPVFARHPGHVMHLRTAPGVGFGRSPPGARLCRARPPQQPHHPAPASPPRRATGPAPTCGCASRGCPASWSPTLTRASPFWWAAGQGWCWFGSDGCWLQQAGPGAPGQHWSAKRALWSQRPARAHAAYFSAARPCASPPWPPPPHSMPRPPPNTHTHTHSPL